MKKRRYFWGFLKAQENWLNKMSQKGYRLVKTHIGSYDFEECEPGKYVYAVEYIGNKSFKDGAEYKQFLEDCGYTVFYKNINLDYSFAKAEIRPWADKGGRIATDKGAHNKELLIIEKENDGKPFELHTTSEDKITYHRQLLKPALFVSLPLLIFGILTKLWYVILIGAIVAVPAVFHIVKIVCLKKAGGLEEQGTSSAGYRKSDYIILAILIVAAVGLGMYVGKIEPGSFSSGTKLGYVGTSTTRKMEARYSKINGKFKQNLNIQDGALDIDIVTKSGNLNVTITDSEGNVIFEEQLGEGEFTYSIPMEGKARITLEADNHSGSYSFQ